jgi:hypothetical protein
MPMLSDFGYFVMASSQSSFAFLDHTDFWYWGLVAVAIYSIARKYIACATETWRSAALSFNKAASYGFTFIIKNALFVYKCQALKVSISRGFTVGASLL